MDSELGRRLARHALEGVAEGALGAVAELGRDGEDGAVSGSQGPAGGLDPPVGQVIEGTVVGGNHRPERLDEEHLGELVAHVGSAGFGVRELLAEKLKQWAESGSRLAVGADPDGGR